MDEIIYVQAVDRRIVIHTRGDPHIGPLIKQLELLLSQFGFARADANRIVRLNQIVSRDKKTEMIYLDDDEGMGIKITRRNKGKFF